MITSGSWQLRKIIVLHNKTLFLFTCLHLLLIFYFKHVLGKADKKFVAEPVFNMDTSCKVQLYLHQLHHCFPHCHLFGFHWFCSWTQAKGSYCPFDPSCKGNSLMWVDSLLRPQILSLSPKTGHWKSRS